MASYSLSHIAASVDVAERNTPGPQRHGAPKTSLYDHLRRRRPCCPAGRMRMLLSCHANGGDIVVIEGRAGSVGELVAEVRRVAEAFKPDSEAREEIWFRGQFSCEWNLTPNFYRRDLGQYHYIESALLDRFQSLATPIVSQIPATPWEWYFLARHHKLPSRLLDWTESVFVAAYFAIADHLPEDRLKLDRAIRVNPDAPVFEECPTVWILDAGSLNLVSIGHDKIVVPDGPRSEPYLPENLDKSQLPENAWPMAIMPARANPRIVAQHGMFTVHGHETIPLDELAATHDDIKLGRVRLDRSRIAHMAEDLRRCGTHQLTVFPDLDSVARHVCWIYQSSV